MGGLTLEQMLAVSTSAHLSEDEIEDIYAGLDDVDEDVAEGLEKTSSWQLFCLAQHIMRSKQEQLSVAVEEIEKLAEAAGENEELKQRNSELQRLVNKYKNKTANGRSGETRGEVEELQADRNQLKKDLKAKQRQLDEEIRQNELLRARLETAEGEQRESRRQADQLAETLEDMRRGYESRSDQDDAGERQYAELVRQKNQYINTLLDDVETHDRENAELKSQVTSLGDQLAVATQQIETMTSEFDELRRQWRDTSAETSLPAAAPAPAADAGAEAESRRRLEAQVAELRTVKARRDRQFDQLAAIVEQRTDEFKRLISGRDAEIEELRAELQRAKSQAGGGAGELSRRLQLQRQCEEQRRQLSSLQGELRRATAEMEAGAALLERTRASADQQREDGAPAAGLLAAQSELARSQAQVRQLTEQLQNTEQQAADYNDQLTEVTARLRAVLEGEFGLAEAVSEIKERQRQLGVRDRQLAEQNQHINLVQRHLAALVDENTALRSRLGMEPHEAAELVEDHAGRERLVHVLEREVAKLEEERIALKLENRKLSRQLRSGTPGGLSTEEIRDICRQRKQFWDYVKRLGPAAVAPATDRQHTPDSHVFQRLANQEAELAAAREQLSQSEAAAARLLTENDQLRQGMREILESVRDQDGSSAVKLAAPSLDSLLQALETRHLLGSYHSALLPYNSLQRLEGKNDELRDQLRTARAELQLRGGSPAAASAAPAGGPLQLPAQLTGSSGQLIGQLTSQLVLALKALDEQRGDSDRVAAELEQLRQKMALLRHQTALLYRQRAEDADRWQAERRQLTTDAEQAGAESQDLRAQLKVLETGALALQAPVDEQRTAVLEAHRQMAVRVSELLRCERRLRLLTVERDELSERLGRVEAEAQAAQLTTTDRIAVLSNDKARLQFQMSLLQRELEQSAPLSRVTEVGREVELLSGKYTALLENQRRLLSEESTSRLLEMELSQLREQLVSQQKQLEKEAVPPEPDSDNVTVLRAQLSEVTSRERQQRQRAEHAHKMAQLLKEQLSASERRAAELENAAAELAEAGAAGRRALAQLADQLTTPPAAADAADTAALQQKLAETESERARLSRTLQVATSQLEYMRSQQVTTEEATARLRQQWAQLQDTDDLRAVIASLHQRLLGMERSESELKYQLSTARAALQSAEARIYKVETEAADVRVKMFGMKTNHAKKIRTVRCVVQELRGCLRLPQRALQERLCQSLVQLLSQRQRLQKLVCEAQEARDAAEGEREGVRVQAALLQKQLEGTPDGASRRALLARCQEAELQVASVGLRADRLGTECEHLRAQLNAEERRATDAETAICRLKNELELRHLDQELEAGPEDGDSPAVSAREAASPQQERTPAPTASARGVASPQPAGEEKTAAPAAGERRSRLPVPRGRREPSPTARYPGHGDNGDAEMAAQQDACQKHASALRHLVTSPVMTPPWDVSALEARLAAALEGPNPAAQLLVLSTDLLQSWKPPPPPPPVPEREAEAPPDGEGAPPRPRPRRGTWTEDNLAASMAGLPSADPSADRSAVPAAGEPADRRLLLAEAAASSLRQRLQQKEQAVAEYRRLLARARQQTAELALRQQAERVREAELLRQQRDIAAASTETDRSAAAAAEAGGEADLSGSQLSRLHESSELLAEQERAIGALMERLRHSRQQETQLRDRVKRLEQERRDAAEVLGRTVTAVAAERSQLREQLERERRQAAAQADAVRQAQQQAQMALVSRLREILLNKEKQHQALARVLRDIKADVLKTVEEVSQQQQQQQLKAERPASPSSVGGGTEGAPDGLSAQLLAVERELDVVKNDLNERTLQCHRLQADLHEAERRRRQDTQRLQRHLDQARASLRAAEQAAPASGPASARPKPPSDPQKIQEELAKWEERKRWQRGAEKLRARLREKETECERQQAQSAALRDTIRRLEREKAAYEAKIRTLTGMMSEERYRTLERENACLREEAAQLRGAGGGEAGAVQLERLRQQVQTLTARLAEQRAAARRAKGSVTNVAKYESELAQLRDNTTQLQLENAQLKQQLAELRAAGESAPEPGIDRAAGSGDAEPVSVPEPAAPPADAGTVSILRRLVERLRAENLRLRRELLRHTVTSTTEEQVDLLKQELHRAVAERDNMAAQLQRLRALQTRVQ